MAKYIYKDGERRKYRGVNIYYSFLGNLITGYYELYHWYIPVTRSIASGVSIEEKEWFKTLKDARERIDRYYRAVGK